MAAPLIGLSTYREQARYWIWDEQVDLLTSTYATSIEAAGGAALLLPPQRAEHAAAIVARLDGLVITGGADVNPARYGAVPHPQSSWCDLRDGWELALLDAAAERDLPTLGICRGQQLMAVHAGGTLEQHVPDRVGDDRHSATEPVFTVNAVTTAAGSRLRDLVGERVQASCHHHQSVRTHPGFVVAAAAPDGTVEALERPDRRFWLAVQWHPEQVADLGLLAGLVQAAAGRPHAGDQGR